MTRTPSNSRKQQDLLRATDITKSFRRQEVVMGISLAIRRGEIVGLLGPNGAGKSTLMSVITGVQFPDSGSVEIDGIDVTGLPIYARAQLGLSYLPQETSVFRGLSVEDNILLYLESFERSRQRRFERLDALLSEFGLTEIRTRIGSRLSGGERRRCEIARTLAANPKYVVLDEPFTGVDPLAISSVRSTIAKLRDRGIGVLISDHNVRETLSIVGRAYIMESGRLLAWGTPEEIVSDKSVRYFYLGDSLDK
jgi:lipopolysaccharide export system ATP-binding protein